MPNPKNPVNPRYLFIMTPDGYAALQAIADRDRRAVADVVRIALEAYVEKELGRPVDFRVKRGGRPRKDKPPAE